MGNLAIKLDFPVLGRNDFGALKIVPAETAALVAQVKAAVGWKEGIEDTGYKGGFEARHIDIYGYDVSRQLAVVQLRRCWKKRESWYPEVSKAYALIGVDDGQVFSHTLDGSPRRQRDFDMQSPEDTVRWAEAKIFDVPVAKLATIIRQGDVALIPVKFIPRDAVEIPLPAGARVHKWTFGGSHQVVIDGQMFETDSAYYAHGLVEVAHAPGQHRPVAAEGRFRVTVGLRGLEPWWADTELGD